MSDAVKEFLDVLNDRLLKKPKPFDRQGVVKRVEGRTAYVRFNGSDIETPVQMTINCAPGDTVQTRVAGKNAWLVGNLTAPPTDDKLAAKSHMQAKLAYNKAVKAGEKVDKVDEKVMLVDEKAIEALASANGKSVVYHSAEEPTGGEYQEGDTWFDTDDDNKIYKWSGSAWSPVLLGDDAIDNISANKITAGEIDASQITVSNLDAGNITSGTLDANRINVTDLIRVGNIATDSDIPTNVSDLNNDSGFVTADGIVMRNLVKNGYWDADFKNNVTGWTKESSAVLNYDASTDLYAISCSSSYYGLTQTISVEANTDYVISASVGSNFHLGFGAPSYPKDSGTWSTASDGRKYKVVNSGSRTSMAVYAYAEADTCYINRIKVEKGSTYTGWYDDNTKDLSSKYLKFDTTNGLDIGYSGTNAKVNIDGSSVSIYDTSGNDVAEFGSTTRVGSEDADHVIIASSGMEYWKDEETRVFRVTPYNQGCNIYGGSGYESYIWLTNYLFALRAHNGTSYKYGILYSATGNHLQTDGTFRSAGIFSYTLSPASNFELYSSDYPITLRIDNHTVHLQGEVKPASAITGSTNEFTICTIPSNYNCRPNKRIIEMCHGTSYHKWLLCVNTDGTVTFARYSSGSGYADVSTTTWLPFSVTWIID